MSFRFFWPNIYFPSATQYHRHVNQAKERQATSHKTKKELADGAAVDVPSRQQYLDLKRQYPNALLLFRMGDFYETFDDDAKVAARVLRITLTSRTFGRSGRVPLAGIPYHSLNYYLARLLGAGHTVAIAEQLSEPGRGLVERGVTRVLTPGTIGEAALLPASENRYLAAVHAMGERYGLAWVDVSTGEFATLELTGPDASAQLANELARLNPAECLVPDDAPPELPRSGLPTRLERWHFEPERAGSALTRQLRTRSLAAYGCAELPAAIGAAGAIVAYLSGTNPVLLPLLTSLRTELPGRRVGLDPATRRNLELTRGIHSGGSRGSLLSVLDETRTPMGARALRRLIGEPLRDLPELQRRQGIIGALAAARGSRATLSGGLAGVGDVERLASRITQGLGTIRDFLTLAAALRAIAQLAEELERSDAAPLRTLAQELDPAPDLLALMEAGVTEDHGGAPRIREGFSPILDALNQSVRSTREWLVRLEQSERERTGIRSLKVGFNKVFGYYLEVTKPNLALVPADYVRKQTIATGERFITAELKDAEARILAADEEVATLEREALGRLAGEVTAQVGRLLATATRVAQLDALLSLAEVGARGRWVAPILEESDALHIVAGRHPVVEASLAGEAYIPNDCRLGGVGPKVLLVTGPNMGGKSTYLRQVALIVLLAQIGSFVPASEARIGLVDRIFTRVGAHDDLAGGHSTFMVEMVETATILHQATRRSLLILDEVGRGTSTNDGMAIARAVLEDIQGRVGARTLFATHYLELTALAASLPRVENAHVAALESDGRVVFLYAVQPGPADRSYGIQVARLAGLPAWVADRAETLLSAPVPLAPVVSNGKPPASVRVAESAPPAYQLHFDGFAPGQSAADHLANALRDLDLNRMSPRQAIDWLFDQQAKLRGVG
jgi:DNA mismatch repair protein MutS